MKTLIFGARTGLGDRLFSMAYGLRLARILKRKPILWWPKTDACDVKFEELFKIPDYLKIKRWDENNLPLSAIDLYINKENSKKEKGKNFCCLDLNENLKTILIKLASAYYSAHEKKSLNKKNYRKKIIEEIGSHIRKLKPIKELREKIKSFEKNFDKNTVSVHLRRTDYPKWLFRELLTEGEVIKMFKRYLEKNPKTKFFLATDSKKTESELKKALKDKIITYPNKYWVEKRDKNRKWRKNIYRSKDSVKDSLIDLYLLSKNETFLRLDEPPGEFSRLPPILNLNQKIITLRYDRSLIERLIVKSRRLKAIIEESFDSLSLDLLMGKIGIFLKKHSPELYSRLKNLKKRINKTEKKQREQILKYPKKLPGSFWGITTFYNPNKYENRLKNYKEFRKSSKNQGLKLICIELAFGDSKFELKKGDADILVQLRAKDLLWQKERLINLGLKYLPKDCDKFAWVDSDIIFQNNDWINQTCNSLESYVVVQPFSSVISLPHNYKIDPNNPLSKNRKRKMVYGATYGIVHFGKKVLESSKPNRYRPGIAWAARRKPFDKNKLYDSLIMGGADGFMVHAFYGNKNYLVRNPLGYNPEMIKDQSEWLDKIYKDVKGSVYYTKGLVFHLWHGKRKNRFHFLRGPILKKYDFNPKTDIKIDKKGCWVWTTNKPELHKLVKKYFWMRNEEGLFFRDIILFFYRIKQKISLLKHKILGKIGIFLYGHLPRLYLTLKNFQGFFRKLII